MLIKIIERNYHLVDPPINIQFDLISDHLSPLLKLVLIDMCDTWVP